MGFLSEHEGGPVYEVTLTCPECGHRWPVEGRQEYGCWWPVDDDDETCPECQSEGEL